jgi:hypothetical protein
MNPDDEPHASQLADIHAARFVCITIIVLGILWALLVGVARWGFFARCSSFSRCDAPGADSRGGT